MRKPFLLIASVCLLALGVLGYTFLYAGSTDSNKNGDTECAAACEKAHDEAHANAGSGDCPYGAKKAADGCCATKGSAENAHDKEGCRTYAKGGEMSKGECSKFHESAKAKAEAENAKIEIK